MNQGNYNRSYWLHIRLTKLELDKLNNEFSHSTCRKRSEFARKKLLNKPVTVYHRNQSIDDFVSAMIRLRNELSAIGNNFNQAVKKLHTLDHISEIRTWALTYDQSKDKILEKTAEIKEHICKISDQWSQESTVRKV